ncbi:MAG: hypothetical protein V3V08_23535 [Nannocystaceae bacterium]
MGGVAALPTDESPEYRFAGALIREAIVEAIKGNTRGSSVCLESRQAQSSRARGWFFSAAFTEICHTFEADPEVIRKVALEVIDRNRETPKRQVKWREGPRVSIRGNEWGICPECGREFASMGTHRRICDGGDWEFLG